jgi:putative FmdB family regulatory protein
MPLFEFRCQECEKQFTFLAGMIAESAEAKCPRCGSQELKKLMSRFSRGRSDDDRMEHLAERLESSDFDDDKAARRFAREMGREMGAETGEDLSDEIEEMIEMESREELSQEGEAGPSGRASSADDGTIY